MSINKICLGTAKIGDESYGYPKKVTETDSRIFLEKAYSLGIRSFDTSPRYGDAEKIIGMSLIDHNRDFQVSSKIENLIPNDKHSKDKMLESVSRSLDNLAITSLDVCYLHQNNLNIISDKYIIEGLFELKSKAMVKNVGTSIYLKDELEFTIDSGIYDWIQIPVNILDTSFYMAAIERSDKIKIAARSIFLQGLFYDRESINSTIPDSSLLKEMLAKIQNIADKYGLTIGKLIVGYINSLTRVQQIIVGTISTSHLENIIKECYLITDLNLISDLNKLSLAEKKWTNPKKWQV
jgi:aryl-alcohol dehydrogenase-like predicted oxidoreductase